MTKTNLTYDKVTTALLVVDPYNDFISEGGIEGPVSNGKILEVGTAEFYVCQAAFRSLLGSFVQEILCKINIDRLFPMICRRTKHRLFVLGFGAVLVPSSIKSNLRPTAGRRREPVEFQKIGHAPALMDPKQIEITAEFFCR
jgi:hypothetical protein